MLIDERELVLGTRSKKGSKVIPHDTELKHELKTIYFPVWEELSKKYFSEEMSKRILKSIEAMLEPTSSHSVAQLASQMESVFCILELVRMGKIKKAENLYFANGESYFDRKIHLINYLSKSYFAKELIDIMSKDLIQVYSTNEKIYIYELNKMRTEAEYYKKQGTAEMQMAQSKRNSESGPSNY